MKILTTTQCTISGKTHPANRQLEVTNDLARTLIRQGVAFAVDGTYDISAVVFVPKEQPEKKADIKGKVAVEYVPKTEPTKKGKTKKYQP
jgi:hypothetical protein